MFLLLYIYGIKTSTRGGRRTERKRRICFFLQRTPPPCSRTVASPLLPVTVRKRRRDPRSCVPFLPLPSSLPSLIDNSGMSPELYDLIRAGGENLRRNYCTRLMEAARLIAAERERERFFFLFPGRCSRKERERERGKGASSARRELYFIRFLGRSFRSIKEKSLSRLGSTSSQLP